MIYGSTKNLKTVSKLKTNLDSARTGGRVEVLEPACLHATPGLCSKKRWSLHAYMPPPVSIMERIGVMRCMFPGRTMTSQQYCSLKSELLILKGIAVMVIVS